MHARSLFQTIKAELARFQMSLCESEDFFYMHSETYLKKYRLKQDSVSQTETYCNAQQSPIAH